MPILFVTTILLLINDLPGAVAGLLLKQVDPRRYVTQPLCDGFH
jgi:hypothetical protein